jgi:hypothetical protein
VKLTVFQSDKGDCLLTTSHDGKHILADGGMRASYRAHVAPLLSKLHDDGDSLDLVYVSHIDQDHISGILEMMDDLVDWRVHEYQLAQGNRGHRPPGTPRPPKVEAIWHNAFHEQIGKNSGRIESMLAANSTLLSLGRLDWQREASESAMDLVTSKREALQLSRRIGAQQLDIPLNPEYAGRLMFVSDPVDAIKLGSLDVYVIGPFAEDLKALREEWNDWLRSQEGRRAVGQLRRRAERDEARLPTGALDATLLPVLHQLEALGDRKEVTTPNLASLMLLIEENGKSLLMTGDGHWQDILDGLEAAGKLDPNGNLHVNVLKVPHHGSENNTNQEFARRVTADHYVFCGNGAHRNPDPRVVTTYIESRTGPRSRRSANAEAANRFKLWFNSSARSTKPDYTDHMKHIERLVKREARRSRGQVQYQLLDRSYFRLSV